MPKQIQPLTLYPFQHRHIIGSTGTGKSTLLIHLLKHQIDAGDGVLFVDFHGDDTDQLLKLIPPKRQKDVVIFNPSEKLVSTLNLFASPETIPRLASITVDLFRSIGKYENIATPIFDRFVFYAALALLERPDSTLLEIKYMLSSPTFRGRVVKDIKDPLVREFWEYDFPKLKDQFEKAQSVLNKLDMLLGDYRIRHVISYPESTIDLAAIRREKKILLVKLRQADFGLEGAKLLGRLVLGAFAGTAYRDKTPFHVFIDEAHNVQGYMLQEMLAGIRKQNISLTLANQSLSQFTPEMRDAVLGNCGTKVVFRVSVEDEDRLAAIFPHNLMLFALSRLPQHRARCQVPGDPETFQLAVPALGYPSYKTKLTRRRINPARIKKHIEGVRDGIH